MRTLLTTTTPTSGSIFGCIRPLSCFCGGCLHLSPQVPLYRSTCQLHVKNTDLRATELRGIVDPTTLLAPSSTPKPPMQSPDILNRAYGLTGGTTATTANAQAELPVPNTTLVNLSITSHDPACRQTGHPSPKST